MGNDIKGKDEFYTEEELTKMYEDGYIYFYDVVQDFYYDYSYHDGYSQEFYKDLNECVKAAYEYIKDHEDLFKNDFGNKSKKIRHIQIFGLTNEKDNKGNRIFLRVCDLSYTCLRKLDEKVWFTKDILRSESSELYFPNISEVVSVKPLKDDDLNIIEDQKKLRLK